MRIVTYSELCSKGLGSLYLQEELKLYIGQMFPCLMSSPLWLYNDFIGALERVYAVYNNLPGMWLEIS